MASLAPGHIPGCARLGIARLKAFRLNVYEATSIVRINGANPVTGPATGLEIAGAAVEHILNDEADTAQFVARGWVPIAGQRIDVYSGELTEQKQLFGGRILETTTRYRAKPANVEHDIHCIDPTWLLSRIKVLWAYTAPVSATAIIIDLIIRFTSNVTYNHVEANLPVIPSIQFTNEDVPTCLSTICNQIGAYWFLDYTGDLHVFTVADQAANPITQANPGMSADHALTEDLSQVATRIIGLGGGVEASVDLAPGSAEIPLDLGNAPNVAWYPASGGIVQVGAQRLTYTALKGADGRGAMIGTGNAPTSAPGIAPASGTGLVAGTYKWAITFKTASGETFVGPIATFQAGGSPPSVKKPAMRAGSGGYETDKYTPGSTYVFRVAVLWAGGAFTFGPPSDAYLMGFTVPEMGLGPIAIDPITGNQYNAWILDSAPAKIVSIQVYRSVSNTSSPTYSWYSWSTQAVASGSGWVPVYGSVAEVDLPVMGQYPTGPIATLNAVNVTIPTSPSSSVTGRSIFRTAVNSSALRRLTTINDNTTTTYFDNNPDSALIAGAAGDPPTTDTSALREDGQINAGASAILVTNTTPFTEDGGASGGWVMVGNMTVRYTGISGQQLTGVPATGPGSVTATVRYGEQVLVHPRLIGIPASGAGAILIAIRRGDLVSLRLEIEDQQAAQALATRLGLGVDWHYGIVEFVVNDARFGPTELTANMQATLTERKDPRRTLAYVTRDLTHEVGRLVTINLTSPPIAGTFRIQRVSFSEIAVGGGRTAIQPKRQIEATNKLYTFADLLRRLRGREGGVP